MNKDTNRVDWMEVNWADWMEDNWAHWALTFMNYGLSHEVIKQMNASEYNEVMENHKRKLLFIKSLLYYVVPNDIFSMLQHFIVYSDRYYYF